MGTIKDGLQDHALFQMDGRTWIEPVFPSRNKAEASLREKKIERGWMMMIDTDDLIRLVHRTNKQNVL